MPVLRAARSPWHLLLCAYLLVWIASWSATAQSRGEDLSPLEAAPVADMRAIVGEIVRPLSMQSLVDEARKSAKTKSTGSQIRRNPSGESVKKYGRDVVVQLIVVSASGQSMLQVSNEAVCAEKQCPVLSYVQLREFEPPAHDVELPFGRVGMVMNDLENAQVQSAQALFALTRLGDRDWWMATCVFRDGRWHRVSGKP